jgi:hypothetical protein
MDRSMRSHARWYHGLELPSDQELYPVHVFDAYEWTNAMDLFDYSIPHRITARLDRMALNDEEEVVEDASDEES